MSITSMLQLTPSNRLKSDHGALLRPALGFLALIAREVRVRRDMRRLAELDDPMLHDIGIARTEIEQAVRMGRSWPQGGLPSGGPRSGGTSSRMTATGRACGWRAAPGA